jgi:phosphotriesterase-related protein
MPKAMTVLGPVDVEELGVVMMHEHLLHDDVDRPCWFQELNGDDGRELSEAPVSMEILGQLHRSPFGNRENTRLTRRDPIAPELERYRRAGGGTVVEVTSRGLVPDPDGLAALARETGVHVVAGCGWYVDHSIPDVDGLSTEEMAAAIAGDLREGFGGTAMRAGIVGEIGTSIETTERERKSLHAAGMAAADTGAAIMVHLGMTGEQAFPAFDILTGEGVPADRIVMNHVDEANDVDYARRVADLGCVVEFDTFGSEWYYDTWKTWEPRDTERVAAVAALCRNGYAGSITLAQDVFYKQNLRCYGGWGYDHVLVSIVPMLRDVGVSESDLRRMLVETPKRLLTIVELGDE